MEPRQRNSCTARPILMLLRRFDPPPPPLHLIGAPRWAWHVRCPVAPQLYCFPYRHEFVAVRRATASGTRACARSTPTSNAAIATCGRRSLRRGARGTIAREARVGDTRLPRSLTNRNALLPLLADLHEKRKNFPPPPPPFPPRLLPAAAASISSACKLSATSTPNSLSTPRAICCRPLLREFLRRSDRFFFVHARAPSPSPRPTRATDSTPRRPPPRP